MARTPAAAAKQAKATPDKGPERYIARTYHEIEAPGGGVMRVEPGMVVVTNGNKVGVYPPDLFGVEFPDVDQSKIKLKD
jgi:hypothetical protein